MDPSPAVLHVCVIGTFSPEYGGRPVNIRNSKAKALLALLSLNAGRVYTREYLADLFWGDNGLALARHSLSQALYSLRRAVPEVLEVQPTTIQCIRDRVVTDVDEIVRRSSDGPIGELLTMIRGELLCDLGSECGPAFEEWRSNFNRDFFRRIDELLANRISSDYSNSTTLISTTTVPTDLLPRSESAIEKRRSFLSAEQNRSAHPENSQGFQLPFVGRECALRQLGGLWKTALAGSSRYVTITGKPGQGKTRLAHEFVTRCCAEATVLKANCYESERRTGFTTVTDLVQAAARNADTSRLGAIWADTLGELLPPTARGPSSPPVLSSGAAQVRLFESIRRLLIQLADERPIVITIDDVQWCDASSTAFFSYLSHRLTDRRLFVIASVRERSLNAHQRTPWSAWERVIVEEFDEGDVARALSGLPSETRERMPSTSFLMQWSGGSPYYLSQLVMIAEAVKGSRDIPKLKSRAIRRAHTFTHPLIEQLPRLAQHCLEALAVIAHPASPNIVRTVVRERDIEKSLERLAADGLVTYTNGKVVIRHDIIRQTAYKRMSGIGRAAMHRRVANIMARTERRAGEAAQHFFKSRNRKLAFEYALKGVQQADLRHANEESIALLQLAMHTSVTRAVELRPVLIERLHRAHRYGEAREEIQRHLSSCSLEGEASDEIRLLDAELTNELGLIPGSVLRALISELKQSINPANTRLMIAAVRAAIRSAYMDGSRAEIGPLLSEFELLASRSPLNESCDTLAFAARINSSVASATDANSAVSPLLPYAMEIQDHEIRIRALLLIGLVKYEYGDLLVAEALHRRVLQNIMEIGAMTLWPLAAGHLHMILIELGKYGEAERLEAELSQRARDIEAFQVLVTLNANKSQMLLDMGRYEAAQKAAELASKFSSRNTSVWAEISVHGLCGLSALQQGKLKVATAHEEAASQVFHRVGFRAGDLSHFEILRCRLRLLSNQHDLAIAGIDEAWKDYSKRDVVCRLRLQLELARALKTKDRRQAREYARKAYEISSAIGARPLAENADSLLHRL